MHGMQRRWVCNVLHKVGWLRGGSRSGYRLPVAGIVSSTVDASWSCSGSSIVAPSRCRGQRLLQQVGNGRGRLELHYDVIVLKCSVC